MKDVGKSTTTVRVGDRFGELTVTDWYLDCRGNRHSKCLCKCGNTISVSNRNLLKRKIPTCGCEKYAREVLKERKKRLMYGVGLNDADYPTQTFYTEVVDGKSVIRTTDVCPYFERWRGMLYRCYNEKRLKKHATYTDVTVCKEWLTFSNFRAWMEQQDWEGKHLDKDLLVEGNRVYGPEFCCFISNRLNSFIMYKDTKDGKLVGGSLRCNGRWFGTVSNPFTGKYEVTGTWDTLEIAHNEWRKRKTKMIDMFVELENISKEIETRLREMFKPYE